MNVGDYCRTEDGFIARLIDKDTWYKFDGIIAEDEYTYDYLSEKVAKKLIIKSSPNIIDLIEVGDYVNGGKVYEKEKEYIVINSDFGKLFVFMNVYKKNIKSIVTKEQFKNMEYKVGE